MNTFAERVRNRRKELGMSQLELAKKAGLSQTTISDIERGRNDGSREIMPLAKALKVRPEWLADGTIPMLYGMDETGIENIKLGITLPRPSHSNVEAGPDIRVQVPLISWVQAGQFCMSPDLYQPGDAEEWIPSFRECGPHGYALRVVGDSMVSPFPGQKSYLPGMIILVNPEGIIEIGSPVIAKIGSSEETTFKIYTEDGGKRYLKPLNPQYENIPMDDTMHLCGLVVGAWLD